MCVCCPCVICQAVEELAKGGVKLIALRCAGYERVDLKACAKHGIKVARVPTYSAISVAEHALALLQAVNRYAAVICLMYFGSACIVYKWQGSMLTDTGDTGDTGVQLQQLLVSMFDAVVSLQCLTTAAAAVADMPVQCSVAVAERRL